MLNPSIHPPVHPSINQSIRPCIPLSTRVSNYPSTNSSIYMYLLSHPFIHPPIQTSTHPSIDQSAYSYIHLSTFHQGIHSPTHLSILIPTFSLVRQWKTKMNDPCRLLRMVKM